MAYYRKRRTTSRGRAWWNSLSEEEKAKRKAELKARDQEDSERREKMREERKRYDEEKKERDQARAYEEGKDFNFGGVSTHEPPKIKDVRAFANPTQFADACKANRVQFGGDSWYSNESSETALEHTLTGDNARVTKAQALIDQFNASADLSSLFQSWDMDISGYFPSVPDYLQGIPENMNCLSPNRTNLAPLRIWVCVTSSGGCDAESLEKRGIAIMALAMALSVTRSVSVTVFSGLSGGNKIVTVDLNAPYNLSQVAYMLSAQGFSRGLTYRYLMNATGSGGGWPEAIGHGSRGSRMDQWRALLEIPSDDIIFPHCFLGDVDLENPVEYCKGIFETIVEKANS